MGVVSFALITLIGLMGTGLNTFHAAIATSATSQIFQKVVNSAEQSDFDQLSTLNSTSAYFDDQGNQLSSSTGSVYQAYVTVSMATALPGTAGNGRLATLKVQVARNPGNQVISNWANPPTGVSISTYSTYIGKAN